MVRLGWFGGGGGRPVVMADGALERERDSSLALVVGDGGRVHRGEVWGYARANSGHRGQVSSAPLPALPGVSLFALSRGVEVAN
jgi:hypothetical protein